MLAQRLLVPPVSDLFGIKGRTWLVNVDLDAEGRSLLDSDLRLLAAVEEEITLLEKQLAKKGHADPRVKLLMTVPGVHITVAQTLLAALGEVTRFRDGDHAASYLGLVPSIRQSAENCYHGPITKAGNGHARWVLIQAAQHVRLHPGPLGVFFRRLAKKKNHNVAVVATARKLVVIAWHLLTKNEPYRYAQPRSTEAKLQKLRVQATGQKRKSGPAKGSASVPAAAKTRDTAVSQPETPPPSGPTRRLKTLAAVLAAEGVPPLGPVPPGETRTIAQSGTAAFVASLAAEHRVPRRRPKSTPENSAATPTRADAITAENTSAGTGVRA